MGDINLLNRKFILLAIFLVSLIAVSAVSASEDVGLEVTSSDADDSMMELAEIPDSSAESADVDSISESEIENDVLESADDEIVSMDENAWFIDRVVFYEGDYDEINYASIDLIDNLENPKSITVRLSGDDGPIANVDLAILEDYDNKITKLTTGSDGIAIYNIPFKVKEFSFCVGFWYDEDYISNYADIGGTTIYSLRFDTWQNSNWNDSAIDTNEDNGTFTSLQKLIDAASSGSIIYLEQDYVYDEGFSTEGIKIAKDLTILGNGHTMDALSKSVIFYMENNLHSSFSVTLKDIKFINAKPAIGASATSYASNTINICGCVFANNTDRAIRNAYCNLNIYDSLFENNHASEDCGGAISCVDGEPPFYSHSNQLKIENCVFNNNSAVYGGAIYNYRAGFYVDNSVFNNNVANRGGATYNEGSSRIRNCSFSNNRAEDIGGARFIVPYIGEVDRLGDGRYHTYHYYNLISDSNFTDNYAKEIGAIFVDSYRYDYQEDVDAKSCIFNDKSNDAKEVKGIKIENCIFKKTALTASKVTATYGVSKKIVVTLKDAGGNALNSKLVTVKVGSISKTIATNSKGQVSVDVSKLAPNSYTAKFTYNGDNTYEKSTGTAKVVVKKATPTITVKAKTFKKSVKTKKYSITLKVNSKVMKSTKVTIKVNKKTYSAKTNSKGVAIFKITKLTKKGRYIATVKYAGGKYYNAKSAQVKITVK